MADSKRVKRARLKIKRLKVLVEKGDRTKHDADAYFKSWKASLRFGNTKKLIQNLNAWYKTLWKGEKQNERKKLHQTEPHGDQRGEDIGDRSGK